MSSNAGKYSQSVSQSVDVAEEHGQASFQKHAKKSEGLG